MSSFGLRWMGTNTKEQMSKQVETENFVNQSICQVRWNPYYNISFYNKYYPKSCPNIQPSILQGR